MYKTIAPDKIKDKKDCHWEMLTFEEGTQVAPPKQSWKTWLGWGEKIQEEEAKDEM